MRIIDEKKSVDLSEKVTVELSLKEMALITSALGITSTSERKEALKRYYDVGILDDDIYHELIVSEDFDDATYDLFGLMREYVATRGVFNGV